MKIGKFGGQGFEPRPNKLLRPPLRKVESANWRMAAEMRWCAQIAPIDPAGQLVEVQPLLKIVM